MEKKRLVIGAVALVAIGMVFAGVGYALTYTGTVSTSGESADVNYVQIELGDDQYVGTVHHLYYDTVNSAGTITYTLKAGFTIQYDLTITAKPESTATASLTATLPTITIVGATAQWQIQDVTDSDDDDDTSEYINWNGSAVVVPLSAGVANVGVKLVVTPTAGDTAVPSNVASFGVTFTATETVA